MTHKYYDLLGVDKNASQDQIKSAYRKLAVQHHPDKGGNAEKFKEISNAYGTLSDDTKKREYDQFGDDGMQQHGGGGGFPGGMNPHDIFSQMFGGGSGGFPGFGFDIHNFAHQHARRNKEVRRADHHHSIHISLHDAYTGVHKSIKVCIEKTCLSCIATCSKCQGQGNIHEMQRNGPFTQITQRSCEKCNGSGTIHSSSKSCVKCKGTNVINEEVKIEMDIPCGVPDKDFTYTAKGIGEQPQAPNEKPGDLIIHVIVDIHPDIIREGVNIRSKPFDISFKESILGKDIEIAHIEGVMKLHTSYHFGIIQPSIDYVLKGKGMPYQANPKLLGDMIINFKVNYPSKKLSQAEIALLNDAFNDIF